MMTPDEAITLMHKIRDEDRPPTPEEIELITEFMEPILKMVQQFLQELVELFVEALTPLFNWWDELPAEQKELITGVAEDRRQASMKLHPAGKFIGSPNQYSGIGLNDVQITPLTSTPIDIGLLKPLSPDMLAAQQRSIGRMLN